MALYADIIPLRSETEEDSGSKETVWDLDNFERGTQIREKFGGNLPYNFPVISASSNNEIKSIKSLDATSPYYLSRANVNDKVKKYIRDLSGFSGTEYSGVAVEVDENTKKTLILVIPENTSDEIYTYFEDLNEYASERSVKLCIEKYEVSYHYDENDAET